MNETNYICVDEENNVWQCETCLEWRDLKRTARRKTAGDSIPLAAARSSIMYRCDICGTLFDKPTLVSYSEIIDWDGNRESRREVVCPICGAGEQYFTEILKGDDDDT